jgi:hypothetical protein
MPSKIIAGINPVDPNDIPDFANKFFSSNDLKGTVRRDLTGVESGVNR